MDNTELDDFLKVEEAPPPAPAPENEQHPAPEHEAPSEPAPETQEEDDAPDRMVPVKALQDERSKRQDWKEKALRMEGELAAMRAQIEAAAKAPPAPPPVQQQQDQFQAPPNPTEDPNGYAEWVQRAQFNARLNMSEQALRAEKQDVDAKIALFKNAAQANPALNASLYLQPDPVRWAYEQAVKIEGDRAEASKREVMLAEIGTDPAAYREKMRQELLAELQAQTAPVRQPPAAPQFQSLSGARSVQGRATPVAAEPSLSELFPN